MGGTLIIAALFFVLRGLNSDPGPILATATPSAPCQGSRRLQEPAATEFVLLSALDQPDALPCVMEQPKEERDHDRQPGKDLRTDEIGVIAPTQPGGTEAETSPSFGQVTKGEDRNEGNTDHSKKEHGTESLQYVFHPYSLLAGRFCTTIQQAATVKPQGCNSKRWEEV